MKSTYCPRPLAEEAKKSPAYIPGAPWLFGGGHQRLPFYARPVTSRPTSFPAGCGFLERAVKGKIRKRCSERDANDVFTLDGVR
ncbi:hypothetical protein CEXT_683911 [Caerostris extrusa]|uniref:Uncharacterized protein n=1 Tax=Caerostris extrusa TaxID=172846 RepID=A0AAV4S4F5_CAEEX|nr:hypothetical protein CEXT_683911 [Caerostris extrusa]